jgi:hypothetical protein
VKKQEFKVEKERENRLKHNKKEGKPKGRRRTSPKYSLKILPNL